MSPVTGIGSSVTPVTPGAPADKSQVGTSKAVANVPPSSPIGSDLANVLQSAYTYLFGITVAPVAASPSPSTKEQVVSGPAVPPKKQPVTDASRRSISKCNPLNAATTPTSGYSDVSPVSGSTNGGLIWTRRDNATGKNEIWYRRTTEQGLQPAGDDGIKIAELTGLATKGRIGRIQNIGSDTHNVVTFIEGSKLYICRIELPTLANPTPVVTTSTMNLIDNYRVGIASDGKVTLMTLSAGNIDLHTLDGSNAKIGEPIQLATSAGALTQLDISINTAGTQAAVGYVTGGDLVVHLAQLTPTGIGKVSRHTPAQGSGIGTGTAGSIGTYKIVMTETEAVIETATVTGGATEVKFGKYNMTGELQADIQVVPINGTAPISSVYKDQVLIVASTNEGNGQFKATTVLSKVAEGAAPQVAKDTIDYQTGIITQGNFALVGDNATAGSKFYQFTPAGGQEIGDVPGLAPVALGVPNQISDDAAVIYKYINGTLLSCILKGQIDPFTTPIPPSNDTTTTTLTATTTSITMVTSSSTTTLPVTTETIPDTTSTTSSTQATTQDPTQAPGSSSSSETGSVTIGIIIGGVVLLVAVVIKVVVARRKSEARVDGGLDRDQVIIQMETNPAETPDRTAESEGIYMESFQSNGYSNVYGDSTRSNTPPAGRLAATLLVEELDPAITVDPTYKKPILIDRRLGEIEARLQTQSELDDQHPQKSAIYIEQLDKLVLELKLLSQNWGADVSQRAFNKRRTEIIRIFKPVERLSLDESSCLHGALLEAKKVFQQIQQIKTTPLLSQIVEMVDTFVNKVHTLGIYENAASLDQHPSVIQEADTFEAKTDTLYSRDKFATVVKDMEIKLREVREAAIAPLEIAASMLARSVEFVPLTPTANRNLETLKAHVAKLINHMVWASINKMIDREGNAIARNLKMVRDTIASITTVTTEADYQGIAKKIADDLKPVLKYLQRHELLRTLQVKLKQDPNANLPDARSDARSFRVNDVSKPKGSGKYELIDNPALSPSDTVTVEGREIGGYGIMQDTFGNLFQPNARYSNTPSRLNLSSPLLGDALYNSADFGRIKRMEVDQMVDLKMSNLIAMEGVSAKTLEDFRRDILKIENLSITAIGTPVEMGSPKFLNYFGYGGEGSYALTNISDTDQAALKEAGINIHDITLKKMSTNNNIATVEVDLIITIGDREIKKKMTINHLHKVMDMTSIDYSSPQNADYLAFFKEQNELLNNSSNVVAVHCSAGRGRTGMICLPYIMLRNQHYMKDEGSLRAGLDVAREFRLGFIQKEDQLVSAVKATTAILDANPELLDSVEREAEV